MWETGQKRIEQNIVFILLFGLPSILISWFFFDKRFEFKDNEKVRKAERFLRLPLSSFANFIAFYISFLFLVGGLASVYGDNNTTSGITLLIIGLFLFIATSISIEHTKIWLSDTSNMADMIEEIKNTPKEDLPSYQDGIFSYQESSFTIQFENDIKTINWGDIFLIKAYKIDLYTVDCIVIEIHLSETYFTINDQTLGHMKFMDTASNKLSNFKKDWFQVVAFPAFDTNLTIIYDRQTSDEIKGSH